jgi:hypothetical protein
VTDELARPGSGPTGACFWALGLGCNCSLFPINVDRSPRDSHSRVIPNFCNSDLVTSNYYSMDHDARIQAAIDDLKSQKCTNFAVTARRWDVERMTLAKRFRGETGINEDASSYIR